MPRDVALPATLICGIPGGELSQNLGVAVSRAERRADREPKVGNIFGSDSAVVLDLLEVVELAWHDSYGENTFPEAVLDDMLVVSKGTLDGMVRAARLGLTDSRDLRMAALEIEPSGGEEVAT